MEKAEGKMNSMLGAICGDILGSTYEFGNEDKEISLMHEEDHMTDDSVLTCAIAEWVMKYGNVSALGKANKNICWQKSFLTIQRDTKIKHMACAMWTGILITRKTGKVRSTE